jgi:hypothetical protein
MKNAGDSEPRILRNDKYFGRYATPARKFATFDIANYFTLLDNTHR